VQLKKWLGAGNESGEDVLLVFDECHKAKNLKTASGKPSKTALAVVALQHTLPGARVRACGCVGFWV
jgi:hypothetical protein